ncbi:MAG: class I SAM-dependent methyltransferase [Hyphomicrobiales bacterium]
MAEREQDAMPEPSPWVARFLPGVKRGGHVLDVACGRGRHLKLALGQGYRVTGIDRDVSRAAPLAEDPALTLIEADLETGGAMPVGDERFDGVVVTFYLWRPILPRIVAAVAEDGLLIYETFALGQERRGHPSNPDFLLRPNELIEAATPRLTVIAYEQGLTRDGRPKLVQRIAACGPGHPWAGAAPLAL